MLKEHEGPGMFAPHEPQQSSNNPTNEQPLIQGRVSPSHQDVRHQVSCYGRDLIHMHTTALQAQVPYQTQALDSTHAGNTHPSHLLEQPQHIGLMLSQPSRAGQVARRMCQAVNGVLYPGSVAELSSQSLAQDAEQDLVDDSEQSYFVGCKPLHPDKHDESRHGGGQQQTAQHAAQQRPQFLAPPPAHIPQSHRSVDRPSPGFSHCYRETALPIPPPLLSVERPDEVTRGAPIDHRPARLHHYELHYNEQAPHAAALSLPPPPPTPPADLGARQPPLTFLQPTPVRPPLLSTMSYLIRYEGMQPVELEARNDGSQQHGNLGDTATLRDELSAGLEAAVEATLDDESRPSAVWHDFYVAARTWEYEDMEDTYGELLDRSQFTTDEADEKDGSQSS